MVDKSDKHSSISSCGILSNEDPVDVSAITQLKQNMDKKRLDYS